MSDYTLTARVDQDFDTAIDAVRSSLADQGFGILTEIDLSGTLQQKIGAEVPRQVILGACRPALAYEAITADPSIAAVLPCNVLVRAAGESATEIEAFDPHVMTQLAPSDALAKVADDARERLQAALASLA